jgi:hypothetical protein
LAIVTLELVFTPVPYYAAVVAGPWEESAPAEGGGVELDDVRVLEVCPIDETGRQLAPLRSSDGSLSAAVADYWRRRFNNSYANGPFGHLRDDVDDRCLALAENEERMVGFSG